MVNDGLRLPWIAWSLLVAILPADEGHKKPPAERPALLVRLVHPERQAEQLLGLFSGSRAPHPAAALAAWKRATRDPSQLGKPLEAVIALFNPEMAREWGVMHEAELGFDWGAADNRLHWYMIAPRDDGTLAAAITAERLSGGATEPPLADFDPAITVERLGGAHAMVASQSGDAVLAASARDVLATAVRRLVRGLPPVGAGSDAHSESEGDGVLFDLAPPSLTVPGPERLALRRAVVLVRGLALERIEGRLALKADRLEVDVRSRRTAAAAAQRAAPVAVDPSWLRWIPGGGIMGVASMAFAPEAAFWDSTFTLADGIDRADPTHANAAPLRSRLNLLAAGVGARLEADLWPHLRGLTACVMADPRAPGRPTGALVILHLDAERSADRVAAEVLPRLARLSIGPRPPAGPVAQPAPGESRRIGVAGGKPLTVARRGSDVLLAWGDQVLDLAIAVSTRPDRSVAPLCATWTRAGKPAPRRLGAFWPARCWSPARPSEPPPPAWQVLADGPPVVWWGWDEADTLHDTIVYADLRATTHRFLDKIPLDPVRLP